METDENYGAMGMKLEIEIDNLTEAQAIAIEDMLCHWTILGSMGSSRWTAFYADGDGNFHPKIKVNGNEPEYTKLFPAEKRCVRVKPKIFELPSSGEVPTDADYAIDFDVIAWRMHEAQNSVRK